MDGKLRQAASVLLLVGASGCFQAGDPREAIDGSWQPVRAVAYREVVMRDGRPVSVRVVAVADKKVATIFENRLDGSASVHAALKR